MSPIRIAFRADVFTPLHACVQKNKVSQNRNPNSRITLLRFARGLRRGGAGSAPALGVPGGVVS
jgi:hypothetical protein